MKTFKILFSAVFVTLSIGIASAQNLTGTWLDQYGNPYYLKQDGNNIYWFGEKKSNKGWANVFVGTRNGDDFSGTFYDVPKGSARGSGNIGYKIEVNLLRMISGSGFGSTVLTKSQNETVSPRGRKYLGPRDEQFNDRSSLTGLWHGNDGGRYYVRQVGNKVVWFGENRTSTGRRKSGFANVAIGTRLGNRIRMKFVDVPKGTANGKGNFELTINNNNRVMTKPRTNFGATKFVKEGSLNITNGIVPKHRISNLLNVIFSGVKIHINNFGSRNGSSWYLVRRSF